MRRAPPFRIEARRDRRWSLFSALLWAAAVLAVGAAWLAHAEILESTREPRMAPGLSWVNARIGAIGLCAVGAGLLGWRLARPSLRRLRWDGQTWWITNPGEHDERTAEVVPVLDFDRWLLLRIRPPGGTGWLAPSYLALGRANHHGEWTLLRSTLYSQRMPPP